MSSKPSSSTATYHDPRTRGNNEGTSIVSGAQSDSEGTYGSIFSFKSRIFAAKNRVNADQTEAATIEDLSVFSIHPETLRIYGYFMFLVMLLISYIITDWIMKYDLTHSLLVQNLGYNNVCAYFDFPYAREVAAMVYVFGEFPYCGYIFLNYVRFKKAEKLGYVTSTYIQYMTVSLVIEFILVSWFRMVFVVKIMDSILWHTEAFVGLQIGLILNSVNSFAYYIKIINYTKWQLILSLTYIASLILVTVIKNVFTQSALLGSPVLNYADPNQVAIAKTFDRLWLLLAFVAPPLIAWKLRKESPNLTFSF